MATITSLIALIIIILLSMFIFIIYQFNYIKSSFWEYRQIDTRELVRPMEINRKIFKGPKIKPKHKSDADLFEYEHNPSKN